MPIKQKPLYPFRRFPGLLLLIMVLSCGGRDHLAGVYKAEERDVPRPVETLVELKPNGDGAWKVGDEEVPFSWYIKGSELRINTRGGGVIVGRIEKNTIRLTLPGTRSMAFYKMR